MEETEFDDYIMGEIATEENEWRKQDAEIKKNYKKQLKGLINVTGLFRWLEEDHDGWSPIGIVEIEKTDKQRSGYPKHECCFIKGGGTLFMKCDFTEVRGIPYYYVWQTTGYMGDDYSGELLLPLKDGKYFQISYSC